MIVYISKCRPRYMRLTVTNSGSSLMHGAQVVDQTLISRKFSVSLAASLRKRVGVDGLELDRLGVPLFDRFLGRVALVGPFGGAAEDARLRHGDGTAGEQVVDRVASVVRLGRLDFRVVDAAVVAQPALLIEDEHVRRRERAERRRDALRLAVVQIRELEAATLGVHASCRRTNRRCPCSRAHPSRTASGSLGEIATKATPLSR